MTPCEKLGYKVGDWFVAREGGAAGFHQGEKIILTMDDGTDRPLFCHYRRKSFDQFCYLSSVSKTTPSINLHPGDYVSTKGMSEAEYHAVAEAFMAAGCGRGEYGDGLSFSEWSFIGWDGDEIALWDYPGSFGDDNRQLTIAQVLGTTNAKQEEDKPMTTAFDTLLEAARKRNEARTALEEAEGAFQLALDAANAELGEGFVIREREAQPVEDMSDPSNWREGDVVECVSDNWSYITLGNVYPLMSPEGESGRVEIEDDDGDVEEYDTRCFRFHHRPA